jgi:hypothetical protein
MSEHILKKRVSNLTGEAKWKDIGDLVKRWAKRNPEAYNLTAAYVQEVRSGLKDKKHGVMGGSSLSGGTRIGIAIHPELMIYIQAFYPDFMDKNSDVTEFKKRFPVFKVPEY